MPNLSRRARRALIDAVVLATGGGALDRDALHRAAQGAFGSERFAELWVRTLEARFVAIDRLDAIDNRTFETARSMVNQGAAAYADQRLVLPRVPGSALAVDLRATHFAARRARAFDLINELSSNACLSLLTMLGFLELAHGYGQTISVKSAPATAATARGHGTRRR
jgi:hypothetical protein